MKLKNIMKDVRQLTSFGQIIYVQPGEIVCVEKAIYDKGAFKLIDVKRKEEQEEKIVQKEVK